MGVIHKLLPNVKEYILAKKQKEPQISCRQLSEIVSDKFKTKISKSTINNIFKQADLSLPVGRRRKKRRKTAIPVAMNTAITIPDTKIISVPAVIPEPLPVPAAIPKAEPTPVFVSKIKPAVEYNVSQSGAILLQAADALFNIGHDIAKAISERLKTPGVDFFAQTENLIYKGLLDNYQESPSYLLQLEEVKALSLDILRLISTSFQEVRCLKFDLSDSSSFYFDGQRHTLWSIPYIPYDFSTTIYEIKSYINKIFKVNAPFIFLTAPGYDKPSKEFFNFLASLDQPEKLRCKQITLYGNKAEELEIINVPDIKKRFFIFGLWPWQFTKCRRVKDILEFEPFKSSFMSEQLYIAKAEIELLQPYTNEWLTLTGCAIKNNPNDKIRLLVLSNYSLGQVKPEEIAKMYLSQWPNLEEGFQDYSRKIEFFTYTASSQQFLSAESANLNNENIPSINSLFDSYLKLLDLYARWHFLPTGYENTDFSTVKERFYGLKAALKKEEDMLLASFQVPTDYPFLKDLVYSCCRLNERNIQLVDGCRLYFNISKI